MLNQELCALFVFKNGFESMMIGMDLVYELMMK